MSMHDLIRQLKEANKTKIVLLVADGLGGLPIEARGQDRAGDGQDAEPRQARRRGHRRPEHAGRARDHAGLGPGTPRALRLRPAGERHRPGVLEALGIGVEVGPKDVAIRGNFCTIDAEGRVTDRRAGRIPTEVCEKLVEKLRAGVKVEGVETLIEAVREYRLVVRFRGEGLGDNVADTDPLSTGLHTLEPKAGDAGFGEDGQGRRRFPPPGQGDPQGRAARPTS